MSLTLIDKRTGEVTFDGERARRGLPCPICEHLHRNPSWCLIDRARGLVICPRVESKRKCGDAGWLHRTDGQDFGALGPVARPVKPRGQDEQPDFGPRWQRAQARATDADIAALAERLALPEAYVRMVPCGMDGSAWAFPMQHGGTIVGLKLRTTDGAKICAKGSRLGLIVPPSFRPECDEVWLTEGESDLMAAVGAWGVNAVARPGCTACTGQVARLAWGKHLVILADNDAPGKAGAARLAADCLVGAKTATVLAPPAKDVRDWVRRGATAADVRWRLKSRRGW
jgi:hypothetical protein